jgi:3-oxosteroid 1-dehydrogenase
MPFGSDHVARIGDVAPRQSSKPSRDQTFDVVTDVVIVGGGGAGMTSAVFAAWSGNEVLILEKAEELGGTTIKSGFVTFIPNNGPLVESGVEESEVDFLRFAARTGRPERYDPDSPTFGQSEWEIEQYRAFFRDAWPAMKLLHDGGALRHSADAPYVDNWSNLPEDKVPVGRSMAIEGAQPVTAGGLLAIRTLAAAAEQAGADIRTGHRVQRLVVDDDDSVLGLVATTADGRSLRVGARKGVIFGTGGFSHDRELRENFLAVPIVHSGAALTNEGDFVRIATSAGAQLRNMQNAWYALVNLEGALRRDPGFRPAFLTPGDSVIYVNCDGKRFVNEKMSYPESGPAVNQWDPVSCTYPNRVIIQIWDDHNQVNSAGDHFGSSIVPEGSDDRHVIKGMTLEELSSGISERLAQHRAHTGNAQLTGAFTANLMATIERWNELSRKGVDEDFRRGEREVDRAVFAGRVAREPDKKNLVMWPISDTGPFYATLIMPGTLDTKGGPKTDSCGRVLDDEDRPIRGLYGVGNCVAMVNSYWGAGATLGPIVAFAYRAANAVDAEPRRTLATAAAATAATRT